MLRDIITTAAKHATPPLDPCPRSKRWWTPEVSAARHNMQQARRRWKSAPNPTLHQNYRQLRNKYYRTIRHAKAAKWKEYLSQAEGPDVWAAFHYKNPRKAQLTPELQVEENGSPQVCADFDSKVIAFQILFPTPPRDPPTPTTPARPELPWQTFSPAEIKSAIYTSSPRKAPGPDSLTFACLRRAYAAIPDHFNKLYRTLGAIGYHPRPWRQSTTVVIPKPNKPDYSNPKAYRPIALLNCLGKVLEKLTASRLSSMAETHDLLHPDQIAGRPQRSTIDAAMALTHDIEMGRSKRLTTTALFLDVRGEPPCRPSSAHHTAKESSNQPQQRRPPPAISTTTTEVIDFSIEFGFAALCYVVLESSRTLHLDSVEFRREIRVFTRFSRVFARPTVFGRSTPRNGRPRQSTAHPARYPDEQRERRPCGPIRG
jgi:hypothetical protein